MPEINPQAIAQGLQQLAQVTPETKFGNPYSTVGGTSDSKYLEGLTYDRNPDYIKAVNQGFFDSMGNSLLQTLGGVPLEISEGVGYLGIGDIIDKANNVEVEFGNSFSNKMREWNEQLKQSGAPVYTTPENEGFKPWDYKWWATNIPSIASAVSLLIPAAGAAKSIGAVGKAMGGLRLAKKLGVTSAMLEGGEAIAMAGFSRHMEGMMEGVEVSERLYEEAIAKGIPEEEARKIGAKGASETYNRNWPLIATDILQFGIAFKAFKAVSRVKSMEEATKRALKASGMTDILKQAGLEAGEEGYQYVIGEEATRNAAIKGKLREEDYSTYSDRLLDYISDGDFWTSAFFGAFGGAAFQAVGSRSENKQREKQQIIDDIKKSAIEKSTAIYKNDPQAFEKSTDVDIHRMIIAGLEAGRVDQVESTLNLMIENAKDDPTVKEKATQALGDLKYLENIYNNIFNDPTKNPSAELTRFELANRAEIRTNKRLYEKLTDLQTEALDTIAEERGFDSTYTSLLKAETELGILNNDFKDQSPADKEVQQIKIKSLNDQIKSLRDTIKTNSGIDDVAITEKLNINKPVLNTLSLHKVLFDLKIDQSNKDYDKLNTPKGQQELQDKIAEHRTKEKDKAFKSIVDQIKEDSTFDQLKALKEQATELNRPSDFAKEYNTKIGQIRSTATKFDPQSPVASLKQRYANKNLLQEHELNDVLNIAIKTDGAPNIEGLDIDTLGEMMQANPVLAARVKEYFTKADATVPTTTQENIKKQGTASNTESNESDNTSAVKPETPKAKNRTAWALQGLQFEIGSNGEPDTNVPSTSNVAKKIDWEFINQGKLPLGAQLHYEYDFSDEWNQKKDITENTALYEAVYYIDGNTKNKTDLNRKVVGVLPSYVEKDSYESIEAKRDLKLLRDELARQVSSVVKSYATGGIFTTDISTKIRKTKGGSYGIYGRFWNTTTFRNPLDSLRKGDELILAIGRIKNLGGGNHQSFLDTNGHEINDRIVYTNAEPGAVYMLIEAQNGDILPYKLFTHKVKEFPGMAENIVDRIKYVKEAKSEEERKSSISYISEFADIKNVNVNGGNYIIETGSALEPTITQVAEGDLEAFVNELIVQVDVSKINKGDYNKTVSNQKYISTDLNPGTYFHSTRIETEPYKTTTIEAKAVTTATTNPLPIEIKVTATGTQPKEIKGVKVKSISLKPNPKYKMLAEQESYNKINELEVREWMKKNLPQVDLAVVDNLIEVNRHGGTKAWGVFKENGIELFKGAPKGTEHHEAFHAVFNMFLSNKEQADILNEAAALYTAEDLSTYTDTKIKQEKLEERLADDFVRYVQQQQAFEGKLGYNIKIFFKKLWNMLKSIFSSDTNIDTLFFRINTAYYSDALVGKYNTIRYKIADDPYNIQRNIKTINYYFFEALEDYRNENALGQLNDIQTLKKISSDPNDAIFKIYGEVYARFYQTWKEFNVGTTESEKGVSNELRKILVDFLEVDEEGNVTDKKDYYMLAMRDLAKYGINLKVSGVLSNSYDSSTDEKQFELDEEVDIMEGWQVKAIEMNGKDTLSYNVRKTLRQTTEYIRNEEGQFEENTDKYGFKKFINFDEIYNYLERSLSGIYNRDVMMTTLYELQSNRPELYGITQKLEADENLKTQFFTNFAKAYIPSYQVVQSSQVKQDETGEQYKETQYRIFNANRKNTFQLIIDDWYTNLINPIQNKITDSDGNILKAKTTELLKNFDAQLNDVRKAREATIQDSIVFSSILKDFGIEISEQAIQNQFVEWPVIIGNKLVYQKPYDNYISFLNKARILLLSMDGGNNPYKGDSSETTTAIDLAKVVAKNELALHQDSFINVEGKQVYSYTLPTFLNKKIQEWKSDEGRASYLSNWWFKRNQWLNDLSDQRIKDNFDVVLLDGLSLDKREGVKFFDMTDKELDTVDLNMFWNNGSESFGYYRMPILSDTPQAPYMRFKKYSEQEVIDALYNVLLDEQDRINIAKSTNITIKNWNDDRGNGLRFNFIPDFNESNIDVNNVDDAKDFLKSWLDKELEKEKARLQEETILTGAGNFTDSVSDRAATKKNFLKDYLNNRILANAMMIQLTSIDLAFYKNFDDFQKRHGQVFKFTKMIDTEASWNGYRVNPVYRTAYLKDVEIESGLESFVHDELIKKGYNKDYAISVSSMYKSVNQTDAQAYITVDRYKQIQVGLGNWTDNHEKAYKLIKAGKAWDDSFGLMFQPIKPFYFGHEVVGDLIIPVQNKNSEVVLLPGFANKHPKLKKMLAFMEKNKIDSVQFTSAVKSGEYGAATVDNMETATVHTLDNKYWGVQQEVPEHHIDTENLLGSQLKKLITGDIPENAKFFNGKMNKKELVEIYQKLLTQNIIDSYNQVAEELGDIKKVQKILLEQVIERNLGEYYENALEIVKDQQGNDVFNIPLFHPIHAKRFENMLNSIIRNRVIKQKINGASFALMSNFGTSNNLKVVTNEKTGAVEYMEVLLPAWTKELFPRKPNGEVDIEYINEEAPELLDLFGYRIPTEHKYSMKKLKVVGFTPDMMGGIAILPAEITKIAGEDFDIDKMYVMIPNFENKDGKLQKLSYDLNKISKDITEGKLDVTHLTKAQRDNFIMDIIGEIWSNPSVSDQILIPGGFPTLSKIAEDMRSKYPYDTNDSPILPSQQMTYFKRNSNGSKLIGIAANHNTHHSILQYTDVEFESFVSFDKNKEKKLNKIKAFDGKLISRNVSEFLAAFVDNAKDPVADDLNLNDYTFNTVAMIVRLGYSLETAMAFINQPIIRQLTKDYQRSGGGKINEYRVTNELINTLNSNLEEEVRPGAYALDTLTLKGHIVPFTVDQMPEDFARYQLLVLHTFKKYKEQADKLGDLMRASRSDVLGTGKTIAGNSALLQLVNKTLEETELKGASDLFIGNAYPLVKIATEYGVRKPQNEILSKFFPYGNQAYTSMYDRMAEIKGSSLTENDINTINNFTLNYVVSGFGFFNQEEKADVISLFPKAFLKIKSDPKFSKFELVRYLKYVSVNPDNPIARIEFSSAASIGKEQTELITRSWEAMLTSDDEEISKFAKRLVKYSFFTSGLTFIPRGFGHLIPTTYLDKLTDTDGLNFRDYLYKLLGESQDVSLFNNFIEQLYRHSTGLRLLKVVSDKDITNKIMKASWASSIMVKPDVTESEYVKMYNQGKEIVYKKRGYSPTGELVYNILSPLGYKGIIYEFNRFDTKDSILRVNALPEFEHKDFYSIVEDKTPGQEMYQIANHDMWEIKYGLRDGNGQYKKFGKERSSVAYKKAINEAARINGELKNTTYKAKLGKQVQDGQLYWIVQIDANMAQLDNAGTLPNNELNNTLKQYLQGLGVKVEYVDHIYNKLGKDIVAVADLTGKIIKVAKDKEAIDTLPEETGHFVEAYNRGNEWHSRLMELVVTTDTYRKVLEDYNGVYSNPDDYKREAVGKLIGQALIKKNQEEVGGITDSIKRIAQRLWDRFINLFKKADEVKYNTEINAILKKVANNVFAMDYKSLPTNFNISGELYQLENVSKEQQLLQDGIDSINKKIKIYQERAVKEFTEKEKFIMNKLSDDLAKGLYKKGLFDYNVNASIELKQVAKRLEKINRNPQTLEERRDTLRTLNQMGNYVNGFKGTLDAINKENIFSKTKKDEKKVASYIASTAALAEELSTSYIKIGKPILVEILKSFSSNPNLNIGAALDVLEKDISFTQRWLDALAETSDNILSIIDVIGKDAKQRSRLATLDESKDLLAVHKELEKAGIDNTAWIYERDLEGNLSGSIVTEYNMAEFNKKRNEAIKRIQNDNNIKAEDKGKKIAQWFQDNTVSKPDKERIIEEKRVEFITKYGERLGKQKHEEWLAENISYYFEMQDINEEQSIQVRIPIYKKELAQPTSNYLSEQYKKIQSNPAMKGYYDYVVQLKEKKDAQLSEQYRLGNLAPQVRKDFIERLYIVDADGKKSMKSAVGIGRTTQTALAEQIIKHENDVDFGLTDENNQPINFVPIYYTRKLKSTNDLSLDFTSSMVAFLSTVNNYTEMTKIVDTLEFTKDVLAERKVLSGKFDPVTLFKNEGEKGKPITISGKDSLAYERLIDYMNMVVYGKNRKDEGSWGKVDKAKLGDAVNAYTALNSLALNIYSSISNVTVGSAMIRMEAIAGEFVTNGDLLEADKIYTRELPKVLGNIGQRLDDSKLGLWLEYMDTLQNYDRDFRNVDAGRNTVFSRLMKTSSLYFMNHAGEHLIQTRMSLALANNTKVKDALGKELTLWEAFEIKNGKLVVMPGLKKVGSKGTGLFKLEEDGQDLIDRDILRFINRQNFVNKRLHGIYNDIDKSAVQQYVLGRIALMFRKFIKPGWNRRFAKLTYNEEGEIFTEGYYTTMGRFIGKVFQELKEGKFSLSKNWVDLKDYEKRNFFRLATEWAYVVASATLGAVLTNLAEDDEDNYMLNLAAYESYRMYSELRFFTSFTEMWRIAKSPAPAVYQIDKISRFLKVWEWGNEVKRGKYEGLNRFEVGALELIPLAGTYTNFRTPEEQLRFYTNNGVSLF